MITTIVAKPTKMCNAACTYCAAPPDGVPKWSFEEFCHYFDRLAPRLSPQAVWIWHGGEPLLLSPEFYQACYDYARAQKPYLKFACQTNLLAYRSDRWEDVFRRLFEGRISTSFDPDETDRIYRGSSEAYTEQFYKALDACLDDGFRPMVIGTYSEETAPLAMSMYDRSMSYGMRGFPLRFNYRYPVGRGANQGVMIEPRTWGQMLIDVFDRWIVDLPPWGVTPVDQMFRKVIGMEENRCPWTSQCGGRFVGLEPNGDIYNCPEFADLEDPQYCFGNLNETDIDKLMATPQAKLHHRRRTNVPATCQSCRHFAICEGGCHRDSVLYGNGFYGKTQYCESWMMTFDHIKAAVADGRADAAIARYGVNPNDVRFRVAA